MDGAGEGEEREKCCFFPNFLHRAISRQYDLEVGAAEREFRDPGCVPICINHWPLIGDIFRLQSWALFPGSQLNSTIDLWADMHRVNLHVQQSFRKDPVNTDRCTYVSTFGWFTRSILTLGHSPTAQKSRQNWKKILSRDKELMRLIKMGWG